MVSGILKPNTGLLADSRSRWWFFAARNNSAEAPVAIWLNGGVSFRPLPTDHSRLRLLGLGSLERPR